MARKTAAAAPAVPASPAAAAVADPMSRLAGLLDQAERVLSRLEHTLAPGVAAPDWGAASAFLWRRRGSRAWLQPVPQPALIRFADLQASTSRRRAWSATPASSWPGARPTTRC